MSRLLALRCCSIILIAVKIMFVDSNVWNTCGFLVDPFSEELDGLFGNFFLNEFAEIMTESHLGGKIEDATCDFGIPAERHWGERHPPYQASHVGACIISKSILRIGDSFARGAFRWVRREPCDARKEALRYRAAREPAIEDFNIHSLLRRFTATARVDSTRARRRLL